MNTPNKDQLSQFAAELDNLRNTIIEQLGEKDARYIIRLIAIQRSLDLCGRIAIAIAFLAFSGALTWLIAALGILLLSSSKILDNMEIGHNVMHGQYDWMNHPTINSRVFDWDNAGHNESWKRYHNHEHHTYTNVLGKDRDFGYGLFRLSNDLPWKPKNLWQFLTFINLSALFEWGVAYHELAGERVFFGKKKEDSNLPISDQQLKRDFFGKAGKQLFKDYIFFPLICWPVALQILICNVIANVIRNIWTGTIIFCGHFTEGAHTFSEDSIKNETRGDWYYRQILGSSNISGGKFFHIMSGHLSCQIEHHLFPDVPSSYYRQLSPKIAELCSTYDIPYNTGRFSKQYFEVVKRILYFSLPEKWQPAYG